MSRGDSSKNCMAPFFGGESNSKCMAPFFRRGWRRNSANAGDRESDAVVGTEEVHAESSNSSSLILCIPETMLVEILWRTTPREVRRLATVCRRFAEAVRSDLLWVKFLPANYREIAQTAVDANGNPLRWGSLKDLYSLLCGHVLLGDGNEGCWIDYVTGGLCRSYSARTLHICWGADERYWRWLPEIGSRFMEVAYLICVWWFDVCGHVKTTFPPGNYTLSWILQFESDLNAIMGHGLPHNNVRRRRNPINLSLNNFYEPDTTIHQIMGIYLKVLVRQLNRISWHKHVHFSFTDGVNISESMVDFPLKGDVDGRVRRVDDLERWEYDAGEFCVQEDNKEVELSFSMKERDCTYPKSGLYVHGVLIRPTLGPGVPTSLDMFI